MCKVDITNNEKTYSIYKQDNKEETIYKDAKVIDGKLVAIDTIDDTNSNPSVEKHSIKESLNKIQPDKAVYTSINNKTGRSIIAFANEKFADRAYTVSGTLRKRYASGSASFIVPYDLDYSTYTDESISYAKQDDSLMEYITLLEKKYTDDSIVSNNTTTFTYEKID